MIEGARRLEQRKTRRRDAAPIISAGRTGRTAIRESAGERGAIGEKPRKKPRHAGVAEIEMRTAPSQKRRRRKTVKRAALGKTGRKEGSVGASEHSIYVSGFLVCTLTKEAEDVAHGLHMRRGMMADGATREGVLWEEAACRRASFG